MVVMTRPMIGWRRYGAALLVPAVVGYGLFALTTGDQVSRDVHLRSAASGAELQDARRRATGICDMVAGLEAKSTQEKLEAVHDGATRTHEIGFGTNESAVRAKR